MKPVLLLRPTLLRARDGLAAVHPHVAHVGLPVVRSSVALAIWVIWVIWVICPRFYGHFGGEAGAWWLPPTSPVVPRPYRLVFRRRALDFVASGRTVRDVVVFFRVAKSCPLVGGYATVSVLLSGFGIHVHNDQR